MDITLKRNIIEKIGKEKFKQFGISDDSFRWNNEVRIDLVKMEIYQIQDLIKLLEENIDVYGVKAALNSIQTFLKIFEGESPRILKVSLLEHALIQYLINTPRRWLYHKTEEMEDKWIASRVTHIEYHEKIPDTRERSGHPEYVEVNFIYEEFGTQKKFSTEFYADDIIRKTIPEILGLKGYYIETDELRQKYLVELARYSEVIPQIGRQFILNGVAKNQVPDDVDRYGQGDMTYEEFKKLMDVELQKHKESKKKK